MFIRSKYVRRSLMVQATVVSVVYLVYRALFTLNLDGVYATCASVSLLTAESYGCFLMLLYFFSIWEIIEPDAVPPLEKRTVDVYIPTYNEECNLLRGTISAALALDYSHETYVLDDGDRPAVKELAERLGAHYIARGYNTHAKAGNLNHALKITKGEFVVILDADHVAQRNFITRILGYFGDEKLGFIQTPHSFYNFDNFQGTLDYDKQIYWEEGQLFYNVIQPGKNYWNGVSFCGSAAMFRRGALAEVGGVATETITEDMHTGLRMHAKGWKSLFVNERLISGQAATDVTTFNTQRLRWGEGNLSIFAHDNPLTMPGLNWGQRLCYLGSMLSWTTGVQKLLLYIAPMLMLLTGIAPINELTWTLGIITIGYLITIWTTVHVVSNGYGNFLGTEMTHMASFWTQVRSTYRALFKRRLSKFVVTSKSGRQSNRLFHYIAPQCLYVAGSAVAIAWAGTRFWYGFNEDLLGFLIGTMLLLIQSWFAWLVICRALKTKDMRSSWRHPLAAHVAYQVVTADGETLVGQAVTTDLNERGVGIIAFEDWQGAQRATLTITVGGRKVTCRVNVRMARQVATHSTSAGLPTAAWRYGLEYGELDDSTLATLWWMSANYGVARQYDHFLYRQLKDPSRSIAHWLQTDFGDRERIDLPIRLRLKAGGPDLATATECLDSQSTVVLVDELVSRGNQAEFRIETPFEPLVGYCRAGVGYEVEVLSRRFWLQEFVFENLESCCLERLAATLHAHTDPEVADVVRMIPKESKLPLLKPGALVSGTSVAAAILAVALSIWVLRDDLLLLRALSNGTATAIEVAELERMAQQLIQDPAPDENRVLRLREAMRAIGHHRGVKQLDYFLANADFRTFSGRLTTAQVLDEMRRHEDAATVLAGLMEQRAKITDPHVFSELLITAARNYAHRQQPEKARALFEELRQRVANSAKYYHEYAGVLAAAGAREEAIELLQKYGANRADCLLLASIYSIDKQYGNAIEVYFQILNDDPGDIKALRAVGDNAAWGGELNLALHVYRHLLSLQPEDAELQECCAKVSLWQKNYNATLQYLQPLLEKDPTRTDLWTSYLQAVAGADQLSTAQTKMALQFYEQRDQHADDTLFLRSLADAMSKLDHKQEIIELLQDVVALDPTNQQLKLRLAYALHENHEFEQADLLYQQLLQETMPSRDAQQQRAKVIAITADSSS